jgi:hypothetical protein
VAESNPSHCLGRRGELGDSLGSLTDGMLGKLARKHEADSSLNLAAAEGGLLVVSGKLAGFRCNALKDVVDEGVHDGHALLGDSSIGVDLLQHLVNVRAVRLGTLAALLGVAGFLGRLGALLGRCLGHNCEWVWVKSKRDGRSTDCDTMNRIDAKSTPSFEADQ